MDRMLNSIWFVRILAFFIALMLFFMVNQSNIGSPSLLPDTPSAPFVIEDESVEVIYDEERFELVEEPGAVDVELRGSQVSISLFQITSNRSTEVFVDASDIEEEGRHQLAVSHRNFPSDLSVSIEPQVVSVTLRERQTASFSVDVQLENEDDVAEDNSLGSPIVSPLNVNVTANRETIEAIEDVYVYVDLTGADETIEDEFPVHFYNEEGHQLDVQSDPQFVNVTVPLTSPNKLVPVKLIREDELPDGLSFEDVTIYPNEVTVFGSAEDLETVDFVESEPIDLTSIEESGELTIPLEVPDDVERIDPEQVTVDFTLAEEEELVFQSIPIEITGADAAVNFHSEAPNTVDVTAFGSQSRLNDLLDEDIQVSVDASGTHAGDQEFPLNVTGPSYIRFELDENETVLRFSE
ncbi:CdaR family protein [Bacillus sp. Marseille-P3800]|uniref:CdaR family protein n=1 Tax=Bacillus sp. Marseille-P3800 TaxID=2014782 RepID=UPI000C0805B2|nr:CdaR family protein [Bacillus sp. Marseille-P3800]